MTGFFEFILFNEIDILLENWRAINKWRHLEEIYNDQITKGVDPNKLWVTFSDVAKLGQRTKITPMKSTPVGIFAFPVSYVLDKKDATPFANREYMHVFKTTKPHMEVGDRDVDEYIPFSNEYENKLKKYAEDNDLNYTLALSDAKYGKSHAVIKPVYNSNQLIYRVAEALAKQEQDKLLKNGKKADFRMKWNKILRYLGISNVADTLDLGHIHNAERTQGIFMDPHDITLIATINIDSHSDQISPLGKDMYRVSNQRRGPRVSAGKSENEAILERLNGLNRKVRYGHIDTVSILVLIIKLIKLAISKSIDLNYFKLNINELDYQDNPKILEKIQVINSLLSGNRIHVPIYKKESK